MAAYLASHHRLEASGEEWEEAGEGGAQGDPEAGAGFAVPVQPAVKELHRELAAVGGVAVFGNDDGFAIGPPALVFQAVQRFAERVLRICNLKLQVSKTKVYLVNGEKPAEALEDMPKAGELVEGQWQAGFKCYGVAIATPQYVKHILEQKVKNLTEDVDRVMNLLEEDRHAARVLLSTSLSQQLDYLLTLQYPSDMMEAAVAMDRKLWEALEQLAGQARIPRGEENMGVECVLQLGEVASLQGRSYQRLVAAQPVKLGGLGRRELVETIFPAFLGGVEQSLPFIVGRDGQAGRCPQLSTVVGRVEGPQRWRQFLAANSRTSKEFSAC